MLVVHLLDLARVRVVLHDVLVRASREEDVLLRRVRVDLDAEGDLLVGEGGDALTRLRVPQLAWLGVGLGLGLRVGLGLGVGGGVVVG